MRSLGAILLFMVLALPLWAQAMPEPARIDPGRSALTAEGQDRGNPRPLELRLGLDRPVPYRVYFLDGPPRLIVDFRAVDFSGADPQTLPGHELVPGLRWGLSRSGWSRLVMELPGPYALEQAFLHQDPQNALVLRLNPVAAEKFVTRGDALSTLRDLPQPAATASGPAADNPHRPLRVAIDPGHGGHDPGAEVGAIHEAAVMLGFATELGQVLERAGYQVTLTRTDDSFVPLERRMTLARAAQADLFISLHADVLPAGAAAGLSIYFWDQKSDDRAARELALRHDRSDLLAGIDLSRTDDEVALVLMDLARLETQPRSEAFAKVLVSELNRVGVAMHRHPVKGAAFSVLKSPDIPSVLVELGFLTDAADRGNLFDPEWRSRSSQSIARAIAAWAEDDTARTGLVRQ